MTPSALSRRWPLAATSETSFSEAGEAGPVPNRPFVLSLSKHGRATRQWADGMLILRQAQGERCFGDFQSSLSKGPMPSERWSSACSGFDRLSPNGSFEIHAGIPRPAGQSAFGTTKHRNRSPLTPLTREVGRGVGGEGGMPGGERCVATDCHFGHFQEADPGVIA